MYAFYIAASALLFRGLRPGLSRVFRRFWIVPAAILIDELICLLRSPTLRRVLVYGRGIAENRVYYPPLCFDGVLAHEEGFVPFHRIAQQTLVRSHLVGGLVNSNQLDILAAHGLAWHFGARAYRNLDDGTDTKAVVI